MTRATETFYAERLAALEAENGRRRLREIETLSAREVVLNDKRLLNFSSNNYLGLADHPKLKTAAADWAERFGTGTGASRLITGSLKAFAEVETRVAEWKKTGAALVFGSGYMANIGVIPAIADRETEIFADKLNHASLNDGCRLSGAEWRRYRHNDPDHLETLLKRAGAGRKWIVSDTVFSMDGDRADIDALRRLAETYGAALYLDDAHGSGVFGDRGEGLASGSDAEIVMGTFSKALGGYGAYIACSAVMRDYLINRCGSFIYSTAPPPPVWGAIAAAVELVRSDRFQPVRRDYLARVAAFAARCRKQGFAIGDTTTPIVPLIVGESRDALARSEILFNEGVLAVAVRPPTVPKGTSRLRLTLTAAHTEQDLDRLFAALLK